MIVLIPNYVNLKPTLSVLVRKHVENLIPRRPVSYTHLDVYKRQIINYVVYNLLQFSVVKLGPLPFLHTFQSIVFSAVLTKQVLHCKQFV